MANDDLHLRDPDEVAPGSSRPLRQHQVMASSAWVVMEVGIKNVVQLGSHILLAWWLTREMFGLISLVMLVSQVLTAFSDVGIGPNIIQNKQGDNPAFLNTAWMFQIMRGVLLFVCTCAVAQPVALLYDQTRLTWLIPAAGCTSLVGGFMSTNWYLANRNMNLGRRTVLEVCSLLLGLAMTLIWAYLTRDVWAMVLGPLMAQISRVIMSHLCLPGIRNRLYWDRTMAREIMSFGVWILITTLFGHLALHVDRAILGVLVSIEVLGVYHVAHRLSAVPQTLIGTMATQIVFPVIAQRQDLPRPQLRATIIRNRWPVLCVAGVMLAIIVVCADMVCRFIYKKEFHDAAWITPILLLGMWPNILVSTLGPSLMAIGQPRYRALASIVRLVVVTAAICWGFQNFGLRGLVVAAAAGPIVRHLTVCWGLARHGLLAAGQDFISTALFMTMLVLLLVARYLVGWGVPVVEAFTG